MKNHWKFSICNFFFFFFLAKELVENLSDRRRQLKRRLVQVNFFFGFNLSLDLNLSLMDIL